MINKIIKTINDHNLISSGDSILVGLSGGADSVSLTYALVSLAEKLGIKVYAAHLNHGIRDQEALSDEKFAIDFSAKLGIKCFVKRVKIKELAVGVSEELLGRKERYAFFDEICKEHNIKLIATAHNKNDNAETIVMNLIRGATLQGLSGIPYQRDNIIRPLLDVSRNEIEQYCHDNSLDYVTDSTNLHQDYTRNKVRLSLLPMIEERFNPNFISTLTNNARYFSEDSKFIENIVNEEYEKVVKSNSANIVKLIDLPMSISRRIIYKMLSEAFKGNVDISSNYVDAILQLIKNSTSGKSINIGKGFKACIEYDTLFIRKQNKTNSDFEYILPISEEIYVKEANIYIKAIPACKNEGECFTIPENAVIKVRNRRSGDIFFPCGMSGKKKIKDYFVDSKIPLSMRDKICIVTFDNEVGYIVGKRRDRRFDFKNSGIRIIYSLKPSQ